MKREGFSDRYLYEINRITRKAFDLWEGKDPHDVNEDDIYDLLDEIGGKTRNQKYYRAVISRYLSSTGNHVVRGMYWNDPVDKRIHVRWLDEKQIEAMLSADLTPQERMIVHLGLYQACRCIEIRRLQVSDIRDPYMDLTGKRHKLRTVPFAPETRKVIKEYLEYRKKWRTRDSPYFIVGPRANNITRENARRINEVIRKKVGFYWSYHDLRRTWGRTAWQNGVPLETISAFLGHSDTRTTIVYLGINLGDLEGAVGKVHDFYRKHKG